MQSDAQAAAANPVFQGVPQMSLEQLLNVPQLDAVLVETEVRDLLDSGRSCIAAGKHIHLDKPAGANRCRIFVVLFSLPRGRS